MDVIAAMTGRTWRPSPWRYYFEKIGGRLSRRYWRSWDLLGFVAANHPMRVNREDQAVQAARTSYAKTRRGNREGGIAMPRRRGTARRRRGGGSRNGARPRRGRA